MGFLYRRKKKDPVTGALRETGPWWMKYYDDGKAVYESTAKREKRAALNVLRKSEAKVVEGRREDGLIRKARFDHLIEDLRNDYILQGRKTWSRREQHIEHLRPVFGGMRAIAITSNRLQAYIAKRLHDGAANATVNRELDCLHRMMVLGQRQTPPRILHIPHFPKLREDNVRIS